MLYNQLGMETQAIRITVHKSLDLTAYLRLILITQLLVLHHTSKDPFYGFVRLDVESTWLNLALCIAALALLFLQLLITTATETQFC